MVSSNFQRQQAGGYEYLDDHHAIQRSTGEVVEANWAHKLVNLFVQSVLSLK